MKIDVTKEIEKAKSELWDCIESLSVLDNAVKCNFPKLVGALEHSKDHIKAEIQATKKRIIELGGDAIEEVFVSHNNKVVVTNPLEIPDHDE
jgi:hypothetical protein